MLRVHATKLAGARQSLSLLLGCTGLLFRRVAELGGEEIFCKMLLIPRPTEPLQMAPTPCPGHGSSLGSGR